MKIYKIIPDHLRAKLLSYCHYSSVVSPESFFPSMTIGLIFLTSDWAQGILPRTIR